MSVNQLTRYPHSRAVVRLASQRSSKKMRETPVGPALSTVHLLRSGACPGGSLPIGQSSGPPHRAKGRRRGPEAEWTQCIVGLQRASVAAWGVGVGLGTRPA